MGVQFSEACPLRHTRRAGLTDRIQEKTLPAIQLAPPEERPAVLVVDDEQIILDVMGKMLKAAGFSLSVAETGEQALQHLARQEVACALVDKNLFGMDGLEVIRHVRKRQPRCACVLMTAYASTGSAVEALRLGVVDYLEKPSPELDLIGSRIQRAIRIQGVREQQAALAQRVRELEQERRQAGSANAQLRIELGVMAELDNPQAQDAIEALRREIEQREMTLLHGAEKIVASLRSLQSELKPGAQGSLTRLLAEADAHLALLRRLT